MPHQTTLQLTDANFDREVHGSPIPVLVDFWAEWCPPCRVLGPTIDALANEYVDRVKIGKVDVDANHNLAKQYDVWSIPTVLLLVDGKVAQRFVGVQSRDELSQALDRVANPITA